MYFKKIDRNSDDIPMLESLNNQAFPENERIETDDMFSFPEESGREVIGIYTEDKFSGFIITIKYRKCVYICYFAVCPKKRSQGIGGQALK
ncbi:MAG: GNAT family N-acetyltransferase, partial [Alistipes senegalensis]|nr:GNAT family N-acetyltransferase [Alistipes senegalensis]